MNILMIHQNFPGQFKNLAPALVKQGHRVGVLTPRVKKKQMWNGVYVMPYAITRGTTQGIHPWVQDFETKVIRAEFCYGAACKLKEAGFEADLIIAHNGWGESLFLKDVWPAARLGLYCEMHHPTDDVHVGFDPEFPTPSPGRDALRLRLKNLNNYLHAPIFEAGICPTKFQANTYPADMREKISVIHDGIDTQALKPDPNATLTLPDGSRFTRDDELITFVNRNLEPYRGYHIFMRALPRLLRERPKAQVIIVGGDEVSYGARPPEGQSWKQIFIDEVRASIPDEDWARVHYTGRIPYEMFTDMLKASRLHIYLTYPFVLSWSLLETMSVGGAILASSTEPVREVITHDQTGWLTDFFDSDALVEKACKLLDSPETRVRLGAAARKLVQERYDLQTICLPRQLEWVSALSQKPVLPLQN